MRNKVWCGLVLTAVASTAACSAGPETPGEGPPPVTAGPASTYNPTEPVESATAPISSIDPSEDPSVSWGNNIQPDAGGSATATRPVRPAAATTGDDLGASAFATYYFAVVDHAFRTGDVVPLKETSTATNRTTTDFVDRASAMFSEGNRPLGRTQQVTPAGVARRTTTTGSAPVVDVSLRYSSPTVSIQTKAGEIQTVPPVPARTVTVSLLWLSNHWLVDSVSDPAVGPLTS